MNEQRHDPVSENEQRVARLFEQVSRRVTVPDDQEQTIRQELQQDWIQVTRARKHRRRLVWTAAASMLVVISMVVTLNRAPQVDTGYLANIESRTGDIVAYDAADNRWEPLAAAQSKLNLGQAIATEDDSRLAIHWHAGGMLRVDENTEFRIVDNTTLELVSGRIYYDSQYQLGGDQPYVNLKIMTPLGMVRHVGTRFMTAMDNGALTVSVRDGQVAISGDPMSGANGVNLLAKPGQQVTIVNDGTTTTETIDTFSSEYEWLNDITLDYQLDGKTARDFLEWVSGESGYSVQYASDDVRRAAASARLSGGAIDLAPLEALEDVMRTTTLDVEVVDQTIFVEVR